MEQNTNIRSKQTRKGLLRWGGVDLEALGVDAQGSRYSLAQTLGKAPGSLSGACPWKTYTKKSVPTGNLRFAWFEKLSDSLPLKSTAPEEVDAQRGSCGALCVGARPGARASHCAGPRLSGSGFPRSLREAAPQSCTNCRTRAFAPLLLLALVWLWVFAGGRVFSSAQIRMLRDSQLGKAEVLECSP